MLKWDDISSLWPNAPQSELFVGCLVRSIISIRCDMRSGYPPAANVGGHYAQIYSLWYRHPPLCHIQLGDKRNRANQFIP